MPEGRVDETLIAPSAEGSAKAVLGDRYEILGLLGAGGMGNVYKARDLELDEIVALKVLRPDVVGAPGALDRFRREVKLARRVTHPNVARVFDIGERGGGKFLTMEFVDGEPLGALLAREGRLPVARAVEIVSAVCAGLGAAHAAGVVHRDLKPDNVLLEKGGRVVLTDFGIARAAAGDGARTEAGFVGTPAYMAPEQVEASPHVDARADLYALGAMMFEIVTGARPWTGDSVLAIAAARLLRPPPDPRAVRPDLPPGLAALVQHCMARNPADRPASAAAIASQLAGLTLPAAPMVSITPPAPRAPFVEPENKAKKRVAVLPFRNAGPPEHDYLADGLTEDLIDVLSMVDGLGVRSRGVVMRHKGTDVDPREVGRELDVQVVVEGTVRRAGGAVRISARLVSVADGVQLWARRFDRPEAEMLGLSDDTAKAIADALTVEIRGPARRAEADPAAMELYLKARVAYHQFISDGGGERASALFEEALRRAPDDPRILAGCAMARARAWDTDPAANARAREAAERAIALAPDLAEAHVARAAVDYQLADEPAAMRSARRALRLAPGNAEAHDLVGRMLSETLQLSEARRHLTTALTLEPGLELATLSLARTAELLGDRDEADRILEASRGAPYAVGLHARLMFWRRDTRGAEEMRRSLRPDTPPQRVAHAFLTVLVTGRVPTDLGAPRPEAVLATRRRARAFHTQIQAECFAVVGQRDEAFAALERGAALGVFDVAWLDRCPLFEGLRDEPRFVAARAIIAARAEQIVRAYLAPDA